MANFRRGLRDVKAGRLIPWEEVKRNPGIRGQALISRRPEAGR